MLNQRQDLGFWITFFGGLMEFFVAMYIYLAETPFSADIIKFSIILAIAGMLILLGSLISIVTWRNDKQVFFTMVILAIYSVALIFFGGVLVRVFNRAYGTFAKAFVAFFFASLAILIIGLLTVLQYINLSLIFWKINDEISIAQIIILIMMLLAVPLGIDVLAVIGATIIPADTAFCMLQKIHHKK